MHVQRLGCMIFISAESINCEHVVRRCLFLNSIFKSFVWPGDEKPTVWQNLSLTLVHRCASPSANKTPCLIAQQSLNYKG